MGKVIAIDGPAGSGKGTVASIISHDLGYLYVDTGAMYRALSLYLIDNKIDINDEKLVVSSLNSISIKFDSDNHVYLNNKDVTSLIRSRQVNEIVSKVASIKMVREIMVKMQQDMAINNNIIMEGRDITTVVFPNATYKFYLDADVLIRAKRRYEQNKDSVNKLSYDEILESIKKRDCLDMKREVGALKIAPDAIYIDTSNMSIDEVVDKIKSIVK